MKLHLPAAAQRLVQGYRVMGRRFASATSDRQIVPPPSFFVRAEHGSVQAWSVDRLPFEPKGAAFELRAQLRTALAGLPASDAVFGCVYQSQVKQFVDTENVLIYNVGPASFTKHARHGLRFERVVAAPSTSPVTLSAPPAHQMEYRSSTGLAHWRRGTVLARWSDVPWPAHSRMPLAAAMWLALRTSATETLAPLDSRATPFGLRVSIADPFGQIDIAVTMKPLLDGIISAFHVHDGQLMREAATRMSAAGIGGGVAALERLMLDRRFNLLGARRLVAPWRSAGVKWNPEDERCVAAEVVRAASTSSNVRFSGELFDVSSS